MAKTSLSVQQRKMKRDFFRRKKNGHAPRPIQAVRYYNRCALCDRPHGYMRRFDMCRICFRELARKGQIMGLRKSSW